MRKSIWLVATAAAATITFAGWAQKSGAPIVVPGSKYGALAVDRAKGFIFGFAYDQDTRADAVARALAECKERGGNCSTVVEYAGPGCAAYRTTSAEDGTAYGWGVNSSRDAAESRATEECTNFSGGKVCSNHVWSCNTGEGKFVQLKSEPVRPVAAKTDCLVQYELQIYRGKDWASRFYGPVYRLTAKDCPLSGKSEYHGFGHAEHPGEKPTTWEVNEDRKNPAKQKRGFEWAQAFFNWSSTRPSLVPGHRIDPRATFTVADVTPDNLKSLTENVGRQDAGDPRGLAVGHCISYTPPGVAPVEVIGADKCQRWF